MNEQDRESALACEVRDCWEPAIGKWRDTDISVCARHRDADLDSLPHLPGDVVPSAELKRLERLIGAALWNIDHVGSTLRRMTGTGFDPAWAVKMNNQFGVLRDHAKIASMAADDLRRRAANPREGGES